MSTVKKRRNEKFPPEEVEPLLIVAQGRDKSVIGDEYKWIKDLTANDARNVLLYRFHSIIVSLNEVCLKAKYWTSFSKTFIRLFSRKKALQDVANMLKADLSVYTKEELFHTGQVAVLLAIQECKTNLASTIVYQFKEQIAKLLEHKGKKHSKELDLEEASGASVNFESDVLFQDFLERLTEEEFIVAMRLINGEDLEGRKIPKTLKLKLADYLTL